MENKLIKRVNKSYCDCVQRSSIVYIFYISFVIFFLFLSVEFTAERISQLQLLLNIIRKIGSTWDLQQQSCEKTITKMYSLPVFLFRSIHSIHSISGIFLNYCRKKMMKFKKQETHNRVIQIFKLL